MAKCVMSARMASFERIFKAMYWSLRRDRRALPHLLMVMAAWPVTLLRLRLRGLAGPNVVAIGLVEHLGDIVAAEPVARFARLRHPKARIAWFTRRPYASLPGHFPTVDEVVTVTCLTEWLLLRASGVGDPAWDLHIHLRECPKCRVPLLKAGPATAIQPDTYYNYGNLLAVQCLSAGLPALTDGPDLLVNAAAAAAVDKLDIPPCFIVIHCASNDAVRDWPRSHWQRLLGQLTDRPDLAIIEVGTKAVVASNAIRSQRDLCGILSIAQTAEVIRRAALFIGIDSGPAHLANAVGTPGIILMGKYKSFVNQVPYSGRYAGRDQVDIIRTEGAMATLPVEAVLAAVRRRIDPARS